MVKPMEQRDGWAALLSGKNGVLSVTLAGGIILNAINIYIVFTILPSTVKEIGGEVYYSWAATAFVIASLLGASFAAKLLDYAGPRLSYSISALMFAIGALICALAPNMTLFLLGRLIQGFGGGFLLSLSYSMISIVFEKKFWPLAIGMISGAWGVSTLFGPAIGGIFAEYYSWRAAFWFVTAASLIFSIIAFTALPKERTNVPKPEPIPYIQLFILMTLILVISIGSILPETNAKIGGLILGGALLTVFVFIERRIQNPLLPTKSFEWKAGFMPIYLLIMAFTLIGGGAELYLPYFLQFLHGQGPLIAGYMASLISIGWTLGNLLNANRSAEKMSFIILCAPILALIGILALVVTLPIYSDASELLLVISLALLLIGIGTGISWPYLLSRILQLADDKNSARASTSLTTVQLFSTALSTAIAGTVVNLAGINTPGGISGTSQAAIALFIFLASLLLLCLPCSWAASKALHNPSDVKKIND